MICALNLFELYLALIFLLCVKGSICFTRRAAPPHLRWILRGQWVFEVNDWLVPADEDCDQRDQIIVHNRSLKLIKADWGGWGRRWRRWRGVTVGDEDVCICICIYVCVNGYDMKQNRHGDISQPWWEVIDIMAYRSNMNGPGPGIAMPWPGLPCQYDHMGVSMGEPQ